MRGAQLDGKRILFWREKLPAPDMGAFIGALLGIKALPRPQDFIRNDIPYDDRQTVAKALALRSTMNPTGGEVLMGYMGWSDCRICNERLGTRDLFGYGFIWPEKAEHYILNHNVWTPDCDALLAAVRRGY
jgi:hypothetical protein